MSNGFPNELAAPVQTNAQRRFNVNEWVNDPEEDLQRALIESENEYYQPPPRPPQEEPPPAFDFDQSITSNENNSTEEVLEQNDNNNDENEDEQTFYPMQPKRKDKSITHPIKSDNNNQYSKKPVKGPRKVKEKDPYGFYDPDDFPA